MDTLLYEVALSKILNEERTKLGIGTLQEKTVHAVIKHYIAPNVETHEIPIAGYVADIFTGNHIYEIQTANFNKLRNKLNIFLELFPVTVIYPIPYHKWLIWIDEETGEYTKKRKSPTVGNPYSAFIELYKIKQFMKHHNFSLKIMLLDMEEYRSLNGWSNDKKRGSTRFDRIPVKLVSEYDFITTKDFMQLIPEDLTKPFTSKEFSKHLKISTATGQVSLNILFYLEIVHRIGKKGNSYLYDVSY